MRAAVGNHAAMLLRICGPGWRLGRVSPCYPACQVLIDKTHSVNFLSRDHVSSMGAKPIGRQGGIWGGAAGGAKWGDTGMARLESVFRQLLRTVLGTAAFVALVVFVFGAPARAPGLVGSTEIRGIALIIAGATSALLLYVGRMSKADPPQSDHIGPEVAGSPTVLDITRAQDEASYKYSNEALSLFRSILQDPSQYIARIIEQVEAEEGFLRLNVVMDYVFSNDTMELIGKNSKGNILIPLIKPRKCVMLDNLEMWDSGDRRVSALLQREVSGIIAFVITSLFRVAFLKDEPTESFGRPLKPAEDALRWLLINMACRVDRIKEDEKRTILGMLDPEAIPLILGAEGRGGVDLEGLAALQRFCEFCAEHYLIVVEAETPKESRFSMRYSRTIPQYGQADDWGDRVRVRLGLSPYRYTIPMQLPFSVSSYHFSMQGVSGQYLARHQLLDGDGKPIEDGRFSCIKPELALQARHDSALPYAHLYTTGLDRAEEVLNMSTRVEFDEVPPGALGGACVVAAVSAVLIWFFALVQPGLHHALSVGSDLPALLLAVPAFAATWIGQSIDRILRSSAAAYVCLAISAVVSLASALVYVANSSGRSFYIIRDWSLTNGLITLKDVDLSWFILAVIASFVSAYLAESLRDKVRSYMRALRNGTRLDD